MAGSLTHAYRTIHKMRQPFRFLAHLSLCGHISGILCLLTGILLLVFFGSNINEEDAVKRVPTWIGIIAAGSGIMFLFMGVTLCILLCKLFQQHEAMTQRIMMGQPDILIKNSDHPGLYPVQPGYQLAATAPSPGDPELQNLTRPETEPVDPANAKEIPV